VEDGTDGTNGYFRRNFGCSAEKKISEFRSELFRGRENNSEFRSVEQKKKQTPIIMFRTLLRKRTQLGIPFRGTKIEARSRNSVPNLQATCSILTTQLIFPIHPNIAGICRVDRIGILQYHRCFRRLY
jgi:hypothetical protein